jgi:prepilin-type N-terminal cleavage/methylation domain-containing protein
MTPAKMVRRYGLTLVELLLVLAILAVLIGMLLPALQLAREASARAECGNNLRLIGEGFDGYHNRHGYFPSGGSDHPADARSAPNDQRELWSWAYHILPYIDQKPIHDSSADVIASTAIRTYYCPTRRKPELYHGLAKLDYAGNAGSRAEDGADGVVVRTGYGRVRRSTLSAGGSSTIMVAEKQLNKDQLGRSKDDDEAYSTPGWKGDFEVYRLGVEPPARDYRSDSLAPSSRFGSAHPSGILALFADGSVRTIRYDIDPEVFLQSCIREQSRCSDLTDP